MATMDISKSKCAKFQISSFTPSYRTRKLIERPTYVCVYYTGTDFQQPTDVKMGYETHGGEDVAIFSTGGEIIYQI